MPTPFPGMDPYLERPGLWKQVRTDLIVDIRRALAMRLRPKYQVAIEQRTYLSILDEELLVGEPDALVIGPFGPRAAPTATSVVAAPGVMANGAYTVELPMPDDIIERYLEVRDVETGEAITVVEILSPSNKLEDRIRYERKRLQVLASMTNLVEIDLLRVGRPLPMSGVFPPSHYRIVISRAQQRPRGQLLPFSVRQPIPTTPIPLRPGEEEPMLPLNQILHDLYESAGYDLFIDYHQPAIPPLSDEDAAWAAQLVTNATTEEAV